MQILKKAATDNWLPEVLQEFLETRGFPADHTTLFTEFWRKESPKVCLCPVPAPR